MDQSFGSGPRVDPDASRLSGRTPATGKNAAASRTEPAREMYVRTVGSESPSSGPPDPLAFYEDPTWSWAVYLRSRNRANNPRYERLGFVQVGEFVGPSGEPTVGTTECPREDSNLRPAA
jgi:hypothetical protein